MVKMCASGKPIAEQRNDAPGSLTLLAMQATCNMPLFLPHEAILCDTTLSNRKSQSGRPRARDELKEKHA